MYQGSPMLKVQMFVIYNILKSLSYFGTMGREEVAALVSLFSIHVFKLYQWT